VTRSRRPGRGAAARLPPSGADTRRLRRCILPVALVALAAGCGGRAPDQRVIVLGFDGLDYGLTRRLIDQGRLPNMARMERDGVFAPLETSVPPESPVAWSNFITGMDAGGHGIFDFVHRDPATLFPFASDSKALPEGITIKLGKWSFPLTGGGYESLRKGEPFWKALEENGVESWVLRMPANYPVSEAATRELSGMGTPDLNGAKFFSFYTSELFYPTEGMTGGEVFEWDVYDGMAEQRLHGPDNPLLEGEERLTVDFKVYVDPDISTAKFEVADSSEFVLEVGEWSDWVPLEFELMPTQKLHGICRFYLKSIEPELEVYVSPINYDPMVPDAPISTPASYAAELAEATGRFYTQGMPEDTKSFTEGVLEMDQFLEQARIAGHEVIAQYQDVLDAFERSTAGFLFYYFGNPDQVSHVMWASMDPTHPAYDAETYGRHADLIPSIYQELDGVVGRTLDAMDDGTLLVVMSDHGFSSWRRSFNLNSWLVENGYLVLLDPTLEEDPGLFRNVDWSRSRAYGMGINGLYVNLRGREKNGIVEPRDRRALMDEIAAKLLATMDPATGGPALTKVYAREDVYQDLGQLEIGPDLQMGYAKGTRGSGKGALGDIEPAVLRDNLDDWTGDHIMDHESVPGVLLASRKLAKPAPSLESLAAAILAELGVEGDFPRTAAAAE
jgi:predicted AlkP superfamily phosphohydrolase/phosphomutase